MFALRLPLLAALAFVAAIYSPYRAVGAPTINLAFALPGSTAPTAGASGNDSHQTAADSAALGAGALVAADDRGIYRTIQGPHGPSRSELKAANIATKLGDPVYLAPILGALYLAGGSHNRDIAWRSGLAITRAGIIGVALKEAVGRQRPSGVNGGSDDTFRPFAKPTNRNESFPSGHTLVAFSAATVWAGEDPSERYLAYGLAAAVGLSRIVKHAHWPSDVFWGALIGITQGRQALKGNANLLTLRF